MPWSADRYNAEYRRTRDAWRLVVQAGGVQCSRSDTDPQCPGAIKPGEAWDLDHIGQGLHPAHRACNRRAGAVNRNKLHARHRPTREW